jgi:MOSC domain-containing protein YiiM
LKLTPDGAIGIKESGETMIDVHNINHPQTRYSGNNFLSFNFTHHYVMIRDRFGAHIEDGNAGENIIIEAEDKTGLYETTGRIGIKSAATGEILILDEVIPAPPCLPFTYFCAQARIGGKEVKEALQYLDDGRRGYYARVPAGSQGEVSVGDTIVELE